MGFKSGCKPPFPDPTWVVCKPSKAAFRGDTCKHLPIWGSVLLRHEGATAQRPAEDVAIHQAPEIARA